MEAFCDNCKTRYKKRNRNHRFCSGRCRTKSHRRENGIREVPDFSQMSINRPVKAQVKESFAMVELKEDVTPTPLKQPTKRNPRRRRRTLKNDIATPKTKKQSNLSISLSNRHISKFDSILNEVIDLERNRLRNIGTSEKSINRRINDELEVNRPKIHKAVNNLEKALSKKEKELNSTKIFPKSQSEIRAIISKMRQKEHQEIKENIISRRFILIKSEFSLFLY